MKVDIYGEHFLNSIYIMYSRRLAPAPCWQSVWLWSEKTVTIRTRSAD